MSIANITFVGGGNMACNIVVGLIANGYDPNRICVTNPTSDKLTFFEKNAKFARPRITARAQRMRMLSSWL